MNEIKCYICGTLNNLLIEEKREIGSNTLIEKNFICLPCSNNTTCSISGISFDKSGKVTDFS